MRIEWPWEALAPHAACQLYTDNLPQAARTVDRIGVQVIGTVFSPRDRPASPTLSLCEAAPGCLARRPLQTSRIISIRSSVLTSSPPFTIHLYDLHGIRQSW